MVPFIHWDSIDKYAQYSDRYDTVISADEGGFIEYWQPSEPFELPKNVRGLWNYKSETDLYEFKKVRCVSWGITQVNTDQPYL